MPALMMPKCAFIHTPKCGGTWALAALRAQGIVLATAFPPAGGGHMPLRHVREITGLPVIASVREPVSWLRSCWRFFRARNWRRSIAGEDFWEPILSMQTDDFEEFVARYLHRRPGYVSEVLRMFADGAEHVCRQEHLADDLCAALDACGQPYLRDVMDRMPRANVSRRFEADLPAGMEAKVREVDSWIVERWYA